VAGAIRLRAAGDYASQRYLWRSGPAGIDLLTLVAGNPWHPWTGAWTRGLYAAHGIDALEGSAWLGAALVLVVLLRARWRTAAAGRAWAACAAFFGVWALGPWLTVAGHRTAILLPGILLRFVPFAANARIPGRAIAVVYLALAMVLAIGLAGRTRRRPGWALAAVALIVACDYATFPIRLGSTAVPPVYRALAGGQGTVLELPAGMRDGFGEVGRFDGRVLLHQTVHGRPIVGGVVARLSPRTRAAYLDEPLLRALFTASEGRRVDVTDLARERRRAATTLNRLGVTTVVLDRGAAPPPLVEYARNCLPLVRVGGDDVRDVYRVRGID
jgi:hypothetical protein